MCSQLIVLGHFNGNKIQRLPSTLKYIVTSHSVSQRTRGQGHTTKISNEWVRPFKMLDEAHQTDYLAGSAYRSHSNQHHLRGVLSKPSREDFLSSYMRM